MPLSSGIPCKEDRRCGQDFRYEISGGPTKQMLLVLVKCRNASETQDTPEKTPVDEA